MSEMTKHIKIIFLHLLILEIYMLKILNKKIQILIYHLANYQYINQSI